jgi:hypothetical protein
VVDKERLAEEEAARKTRQERRERRRAKEKAKLPQHGKSLARVYRNAVAKRTDAARPPGRESRDR